MEKTTTPSEACAYCHVKIAKALKCGGCCSQLGNENHASTFYCKKECQVAHWKVHKKECKAHQTRQILYRAGSLLQDMFCDYRELLFHLDIVKIEKKDDGLYLKSRNYEKFRTSSTMFYPFPEGLATTEKDRKSALTFMACRDAVAWMKEIIAYFLQGLASEITEFHHTIKNPPQPMKLITYNGVVSDNDCIHSILKLTLKNGGGEYALDLAGAQYGYFDPVVPFSEYKSLRVQDIESFNEFGYTKKRLLDLPNLKPTYLETSRMHASIRHAIKGGTMEFEDLEGMKESSLLKLPKEEFEQKRKALLLHVKKSVENARDYFMELQKVRIAHRSMGGLVLYVDET